MERLYLITGANGHLGNTVIRQLLARGEKVRGLILPTESGLLPGVEYIRGIYGIRRAWIPFSATWKIKRALFFIQRELWILRRTSVRFCTK